MLIRWQIIYQSVARNATRWWAVSLGFLGLYYLMMLIGVMLRFGSSPNYITTYNWVANVRMIVNSTPSWRDTWLIIKDEWVLEVGFINYDFGVGIAEWSLFLVPTKMLTVLALGALLATLHVVTRERGKGCSLGRVQSSRAAGGLGASFVALASISLSWVVCCSTPTWVVGLAMMGLGVSTSLWLEPLGFWLSFFGFILLLAANVIASGPSRGPLGQVLHQ